jgi:hypothetical protein
MRRKSRTRTGDMSTLHVLRAGLIAGIVACLLAASAPAAAPVVEESIAPAQISIGESAQLRIKSSGSDVQPPALPVVPGLEFRVVEQLQGVEIIHGATLATTTTVVRVTPQVAGTFIIPQIAAKSQPLMLRVNPANVGGGPSVATPGISAGTGVGGGGIHMTEDGSAFVKLSADRREVYVGESVPIAIELGVRPGAVSSLNGLPALTGNDFTLNNLSRPPDRQETFIDGMPFVLLTWHTVLAPVKPGNFSLTVEVPLTVRLSTRPKREAQLEDQLGDPFMQRRFGATVKKDIKARSPPLDLAVSALPTEDQPPEFSGAVGTFKISSDISSAAAAAGDPLTLRMHVTGEGNFDRVDSTMLEHVEHWKTYPPTSSFKPSDAIGLKGEKIFEQPVVASIPGAQWLPAVTFAYFDPAARRYETVRTAPLSVTISPSAADTAPTAPKTASGIGVAGISLAALHPDRAAPGAFARSLMPLYLQPRFLALPTLLTLMLTWFRLRGRGDESFRAPLRDRRRSQAARRTLAQMEDAARAGDNARFFALARRTLQETLAVRWQMTPEQVTTEELDARLDRDEDGEEIRRLFALADEAEYAGQGLTGTDLSRWTHIVHRGTLERAP